MADNRPSLQGKDSSGRRISLINGLDSPAEDVQLPFRGAYQSAADASDLSVVQAALPLQHFQPLYGRTFYPAETAPPSALDRFPHVNAVHTAVDMGRSASNESQHSITSVPQLLRSDSFDSQNTRAPNSPVTPGFAALDGQSGYSAPHHPYPSEHSPAYDQSIRASALSYTPYTYPKHSSTSPYTYHYEDTTSGAQRTPGYGYPRYAEPANRTGYNEGEVYTHGPTNQDNKVGKRYPCRYRIEHNCMKTFTTSGHASRHMKIHTSEKSVPCSHAGCPKRFTRNDNMKQHVETHNKAKADRPRKAPPQPRINQPRVGEPRSPFPHFSSDMPPSHATPHHLAHDHRSSILPPPSLHSRSVTSFGTNLDVLAEAATILPR